MSNKQPRCHSVDTSGVDSMREMITPTCSRSSSREGHNRLGINRKGTADIITVTGSGGTVASSAKGKHGEDKSLTRRSSFDNKDGRSSRGGSGSKRGRRGGGRRRSSGGGSSDASFSPYSPMMFSTSSAALASSTRTYSASSTAASLRRKSAPPSPSSAFAVTSEAGQTPPSISSRSSGPTLEECLVTDGANVIPGDDSPMRGAVEQGSGSDRGDGDSGRRVGEGLVSNHIVEQVPRVRSVGSDGGDESASVVCSPKRARETKMRDSTSGAGSSVRHENDGSYSDDDVKRKKSHIEPWESPVRRPKFLHGGEPIRYSRVDDAPEHTSAVETTKSFVVLGNTAPRKKSPVLHACAGVAREDDTRTTDATVAEAARSVSGGLNLPLNDEEIITPTAKYATDGAATAVLNVGGTEKRADVAADVAFVEDSSSVFTRNDDSARAPDEAQGREGVDVRDLTEVSAETSADPAVISSLEVVAADEVDVASDIGGMVGIHVGAAPTEPCPEERPHVAVADGNDVAVGRDDYHPADGEHGVHIADVPLGQEGSGMDTAEEMLNVVDTRKAWPDVDAESVAPEDTVPNFVISPCFIGTTESPGDDSAGKFVDCVEKDVCVTVEEHIRAFDDDDDDDDDVAIVRASVVDVPGTEGNKNDDGNANDAGSSLTAVDDNNRRTNGKESVKFTGCITQTPTAGASIDAEPSTGRDINSDRASVTRIRVDANGTMGAIDTTPSCKKTPEVFAGPVVDAATAVAVEEETPGATAPPDGRCPIFALEETEEGEAGVVLSKFTGASNETADVTRPGDSNESVHVGSDGLFFGSGDPGAAVKSDMPTDFRGNRSAGSTDAPEVLSEEQVSCADTRSEHASADVEKSAVSDAVLPPDYAELVRDTADQAGDFSTKLMSSMDDDLMEKNYASSTGEDPYCRSSTGDGVKTLAVTSTVASTTAGEEVPDADEEAIEHGGTPSILAKDTNDRQGSGAGNGTGGDFVKVSNPTPDEVVLPPDYLELARSTSNQEIQHLEGQVGSAGDIPADCFKEDHTAEQSRCFVEIGEEAEGTLPAVAAGSTMDRDARPPASDDFMANIAVEEPPVSPTQKVTIADGDSGAGKGVDARVAGREEASASTMEVSSLFDEAEQSVDIDREEEGNMDIARPASTVASAPADDAAPDNQKQAGEDAELCASADNINTKFSNGLEQEDAKEGQSVPSRGAAAVTGDTLMEEVLGKSVEDGHGAQSLLEPSTATVAEGRPPRSEDSSESVGELRDMMDAGSSSPMTIDESGTTTFSVVAESSMDSSENKPAWWESAASELSATMASAKTDDLYAFLEAATREVLTRERRSSVDGVDVNCKERSASLASVTERVMSEMAAKSPDSDVDHTVGVNAALERGLFDDESQPPHVPTTSDDVEQPLALGDESRDSKRGRVDSLSEPATGVAETVDAVGPDASRREHEHDKVYETPTRSDKAMIAPSCDAALPPRTPRERTLENTRPLQAPKVGEYSVNGDVTSGEETTCSGRTNRHAEDAESGCCVVM